MRPLTHIPHSLHVRGHHGVEHGRHLLDEVRARRQLQCDQVICDLSRGKRDSGEEGRVIGMRGMRQGSCSAMKSPVTCEGGGEGGTEEMEREGEMVGKGGTGMRGTRQGSCGAIK